MPIHEWQENGQLSSQTPNARCIARECWFTKMPTVSTQFEQELKKRLHEEMLRIAENMTEGLAIKDFATYLRYVGEFQALKRVVETYCDEVNTTINER
jgi:siderophore synthetase component